VGRATSGLAGGARGGGFTVISYPASRPVAN
jgi:hypothetical protein